MTTSAAAVRRSGKKCVRSLCLRYSFAGLSSGEGGALQVLCCMLHATFLCASTSLAVILQKAASSKWSWAYFTGPAVQRRDSDDGATQKKPRVVWSAEMHQQFVEAVEKLGVDSAHLIELPGLCVAAKHCTSTPDALCAEKHSKCCRASQIACACCRFLKVYRS